MHLVPGFAQVLFLQKPRLVGLGDKNHGISMVIHQICLRSAIKIYVMDHRGRRIPAPIAEPRLFHKNPASDMPVAAGFTRFTEHWPVPVPSLFASASDVAEASPVVLQ
jgi:hypothetical protein